MSDDRYRNPQDYGRDYGSGRNDTYSSAREYQAAGETGRGGRGQQRGGDYGWQGREDARPGYRGGDYGAGQESYGQRNQGRDEGQGAYGQRSYGQDYDQQRNYAGSDRGRSEYGQRDYGQREQSRRDYGSQPQGYGYEDRGFMQRAGDEVRSWFGDEDAERRRQEDQRRDEYDYARQNPQTGGQPRHQPRDFGRDHDDYHQWRHQQIESFDRDYQEYRNENRDRFHSEFASWRAERQGQRNSLAQVREHMEVVGSDGQHVGTVDKVHGDQLLLTKNDKDAGGQHHTIPSRWIRTVDDKVTIAKTAAEAKQQWHTQANTQALFGDKPDERSQHKGDEGRTDLNKSFSGTY